jgi:hypothetical protein
MGAPPSSARSVRGGLHSVTREGPAQSTMCHGTAREDALVLLDGMRIDRDPPPPVEVEKMARLFAHVISRAERRQHSRSHPEPTHG